MQVAESVTLYLAGGCAGLLFPLLSMKLVRSYAPEAIAQLYTVPIDLSVASYTLLVCLMAGIAFGFASSMGTGPSAGTLQAHGRIAPRATNRVYGGLLIAEVALAVTVCLACGLLLRTFLNLKRANLGFEPANILTALVMLPEPQYPKAADQRRFVQAFLENLKGEPDVISAAVTSNPLLGGPVRGVW